MTGIDARAAVAVAIDARAAVAIAAVVAGLLGGCTPHDGPGEPSSPSAPASAPPAAADGGVQPAGEPTVVATGLDAPWSILRLGDGTTLVSERDTGAIERITASGAVEPVGTVPGVAASGEGGLLGLAVLDDDGERWLYAYLTASGDNRIVRMTLDDDLRLGAPQPVLTGLAKAGNHNGGRIAFGPDGMLYATVGDAARPDRAQDPSSPNGKILRMTPTGGVPDDNPFDGSLVYSLGHRNPQGLAWDDAGQLWAAEFGQNTWDEFNRIEPGGNYGWPVVEGQAGDDRFIDPVLQWAPAEASPSGLTYVDGTFFLASLRGQRIWAIHVGDGHADAVAWFAGAFGRIRDVAAGPDRTLWFLTNNTDGRGAPQDGDDRLMSVRLVPLAEG